MSKSRSAAVFGVLAMAITGVIVAVQNEQPSAPTQEPANDGGFRPIRVVLEYPAISDAPVMAAADVQDEVRESEIVLGVVVNGEARAYPINMLTGPSREIINDTLGGQSIAATW